MGLNENPILLGGDQAGKLCLSAFRKDIIHYYVKPKLIFFIGKIRKSANVENRSRRTFL